MISISYLKQCFSYDPESGFLYRKKRPIEHFKSYRAYKISNAKVTGLQAGIKGKNKNGKEYIRVNSRIDGVNKFYLAHRIAWMIHYGVEPEFIDHINGNGLDNRLCNLRNVTTTENNRNVKLMSTNSSGRVGVYKKKNGSWLSYIWNKNKQINLGTFKTFDEAAAARSGAEKMYGYHENHGEKRPL